MAAYFGKLPTRSDFVKSADDHLLVELIDQWLVEVMHRLTSNPRWKAHYDAMPAIDFAIVGTRARRAVAGHIAASADQSGRRFPFTCMAGIEPATALPLSQWPALLDSFWSQLALRAGDARLAADPADALAAIAALHAPPPFTRGPLPVFSSHTMADADDWNACSTSRAMLALASLLQGLRREGPAQPARSIVMPLPVPGGLRMAMAGFWLALVEPFLRERSIELGLFFATLDGHPAMVLAFGGAVPESLQSLGDPEYARLQQVRIDNVPWLDDVIRDDVALIRLSACLAQERLSLGAALQIYLDTFS